MDASSSSPIDTNATPGSAPEASDPATATAKNCNVQVICGKEVVLPPDFDEDRSLYRPHGKWEWADGLEILSTDQGSRLGYGLEGMANIKLGQIEDKEIVYISKLYSVWDKWRFLFSYLYLNASSYYLRSLQGVCIPWIIGVFHCNGGRIGVAQDLPHPAGWREADIFLEENQKEAIIEAYQKLHDRGVLHGDAEYRHWLIGDDGKATIIDFGFSAVLQLDEGAKKTNVQQCTRRDIDDEMRKVKFMLDYKDSRTRELRLAQLRHDREEKHRATRVPAKIIDCKLVIQPQPPPEPMTEEEKASPVPALNLDDLNAWSCGGEQWVAHRFEVVRLEGHAELRKTVVQRPPVFRESAAENSSPSSMPSSPTLRHPPATSYSQVSALRLPTQDSVPAKFHIGYSDRHIGAKELSAGPFEMVTQEMEPDDTEEEDLEEIDVSDSLTSDESSDDESVAGKRKRQYHGKELPAKKRQRHSKMTAASPRKRNLKPEQGDSKPPPLVRKQPSYSVLSFSPASPDSDPMALRAVTRFGIIRGPSPGPQEPKQSNSKPSPLARTSNILSSPSTPFPSATPSCHPPGFRTATRNRLNDITRDPPSIPKDSKTSLVRTQSSYDILSSPPASLPSTSPSCDPSVLHAPTRNRPCGITPEPLSGPKDLPSIDDAAPVSNFKFRKQALRSWSLFSQSRRRLEKLQAKVNELQPEAEQHRDDFLRMLLNIPGEERGALLDSIGQPDSLSILDICLNRRPQSRPSAPSASAVLQGRRAEIARTVAQSPVIRRRKENPRLANIKRAARADFIPKVPSKLGPATGSLARVQSAPSEAPSSPSRSDGASEPSQKVKAALQKTEQYTQAMMRRAQLTEEQGAVSPVQEDKVRMCPGEERAKAPTASSTLQPRVSRETEAESLPPQKPGPAPGAAVNTRRGSLLDKTLSNTQWPYFHHPFSGTQLSLPTGTPRSQPQPPAPEIVTTKVKPAECVLLGEDNDSMAPETVTETAGTTTPVAKRKRQGPDESIGPDAKKSKTI